jgi:hypothetical protein
LAQPPRGKLLMDSSDLITQAMYVEIDIASARLSSMQGS